MFIVKAKNLQLVQMLRGIAALLVVLLHAGENMKKELSELFLFDFFSFGGSGVDIFFVLSGFIITYTSYHNITRPDKAAPFLRRRFIRIFPAYWTIAAFLFVMQTVLSHYYLTRFPSEPAAVFSTFFLLPEHIMLNGVSWTLTYELFFYLIFVSAFFIRKKEVLLAMIGIYSLMIIGAGLFVNSFSDSKWLALVFFPMNIEFMIGILAAVVIPRLPSRTAVLFIISGALLFLGSGILANFKFQLTGTGFDRVIFFGVPSFLLVAGVVKYELERDVRTPKFLLMLGDGSYSLYLLHLPVIAAGSKMLAWLGIKNIMALHIAIILLILFICVVSILFFFLFEKPIISRLNAWRRVRVANEI